MLLNKPVVVGVIALTTTGCGLVEGQPCGGAEVPTTTNYFSFSNTDLEVDCRCTEAIQEPMCFDLSGALGHFGAMGDGPQIAGMAPEARFWYGDLWKERGEIIVPVSLDSNTPGFIVAIDYETADRRVISGQYRDWQRGLMDVGEGEMWGRPTYALRGPDDTLIVYTHQTTVEHGAGDAVRDNRVWRVDMETGARELIWRWDDERFGQCINENSGRPYQLTLEGKGFDVDARDGSLYFTLHNPRGLMKVSPDGASCEVVTSPDIPVGGGAGLGIVVEEVNIIDDAIILMDTGAHYAIDPETGDRVRYAALPPGQLQWDPDEPRWMHLSGVPAPHAFGVYNYDWDNDEWTRWSCSQFVGDLLTNENHFSERCMDAGNATGWGDAYQGWMLPGGEHYLQITGVGIVKYETATGNGNWFML